MARDGTVRGGSRVGAGRPAKATKEKADNGNPGGRKLKVIPPPIPEAAELESVEIPAPPELEGVETPEPREYMKQQQRDGSYLCAEEIFKETWEWLKKFKCEQLVNRMVLDMFAQTCARWIQCEEAINKFSLIGTHPTARTPIASPFVSMSQNYCKQANQLFFEINQVVKENAAVDYGGPSPMDSIMDRLLSF